ncbi:MAG: flagellar biosynthesis protein FlhB [bacterium]|nr:flagellar biosynthesis protein FlhB [bacterium]
MILEYQLQFFAKDGPGGEKTEEPTSKRLSDARKDGQVAKSKEVSNFVMLFALFLILKVWVGNLGNSMLELFPAVYRKIPELSSYNATGEEGVGVWIMLKEVLQQYLLTMLPIFLIAVFLAFVTDLLQVKWKPTRKPLQPKFSKLNPVKGVKRLFSKQSLVELLKSLVKIGIIGYLVYSTLIGSVGYVFQFYSMPLMQGIRIVGDVTINLGLKVSAFYVVIAAADYAYQKHKFHEDMKMTKQEVKDEYKNSEGDPQVKSKIRQKMMEASRRRMMQAVPRADVVITNPTHYAVALKYEPEKIDAPYIVAKGEDYLAQKIKEIARENNVQIVENKPLARMLYHNVEIGEPIPPELFQAVAEVLAFVYNIQGKLPRENPQAV